MGLDTRLAELGIELPPPFTYPSPNRRGCVRVGRLLYTSGHPPPEGFGVAVRGKVDAQVSEAEAYRTARATALSLLASVRAHLGSLDPVVRVVEVTGMVNSSPGFTRQFAVIDGASDLLCELLGPEAGSHARSAVGLFELPRGYAIEIEAIFEVEG